MARVCVDFWPVSLWMRRLVFQYFRLQLALGGVPNNIPVLSRLFRGQPQASLFRHGSAAKAQTLSACR
jgi:hypothetical protein